MTNEQINRAVAEKVMGWTLESSLTGTHRRWNRNQGNGGAWGPAGLIDERWSPATNLAHAWEVVEHLKAIPDPGMAFDLILRSDGHLPGNGSPALSYQASFIHYAGDGTWMRDAEASTAPMAICNAALALMDQTTPTPRPTNDPLHPAPPEAPALDHSLHPAVPGL